MLNFGASKPRAKGGPGPPGPPLDPHLCSFLESKPTKTRFQYQQERIKYSLFSGGSRIWIVPEGCQLQKVGMKSYYSANFPLLPPKKTEWKWKKLDPEGARVPGGPLMHWDSTDHPSPTRSPLTVRSREYNQFFFQKRNVWYHRHNGHPSVTGVCGDNCVWVFSGFFFWDGGALLTVYTWRWSRIVMKRLRNLILLVSNCKEEPSPL